MLKLGVYRVDQYPHTRGGLLAWLRRDHVDYRLLRTTHPPSAVEVNVFEAITREMQLASGIFRTTSLSRFRDLDSWATGLLAQQFDIKNRLEVQDWAASDCIASLAWHDHLIGTFADLRLTASDLNLHLIEMQVPEGSYVFDGDGRVLQFIAPPFVIRLNPAEPSSLIVNRILAGRALARLERLSRDHGVQPAAIQFPDDAEEVERGPAIFRKIPLVHPHAAARNRTTTSFHIERHSVFEAATRSAHVVRTMNILNVGYFDAAMLERATSSVFRTLLPGGVWILGRTVQADPLVNHASVLVKTETGFRLLERYTDKSEAEDLALAVRM